MYCTFSTVMAGKNERDANNLVQTRPMRGKHAKGKLFGNVLCRMMVKVGVGVPVLSEGLLGHKHDASEVSTQWCLSSSRGRAVWVRGFKLGRVPLASPRSVIIFVGFCAGVSLRLFVARRRGGAMGFEVFGRARTFGGPSFRRGVDL
ncbi:hypothetical protein BU15DRAFT_67705 [Melanogaster broomeanus]|nr:hypothetical protein BU15DRAFT_67705 [Melanogaster broomeanus]